MALSKSSIGVGLHQSTPVDPSFSLEGLLRERSDRLVLTGAAPHCQEYVDRLTRDGAGAPR